jgi:NAD(P) transhydrogenase subunit alpha
VVADTVKLMKPGSVIVDLASEQGGNCELTVPGQVVKQHGVTIVGYTDMPSRLAAQSSQLYGTNLRHLLTDMCPKKDGELVVNFDDEVVRGATVVKGHEITWPPPPPKLSAAPASKPASQKPAEGGKAGPEKRKSSPAGTFVAVALAAVALLGLGAVAPREFMGHFTVFVLAVFVGYMVIWNVTPALHTPLMSVTNAISSIIIIGGLIQISSADPVVMWIAGLTVTLTSINIAGGFAVTQRMLEMFRK